MLWWDLTYILAVWESILPPNCLLLSWQEVWPEGWSKLMATQRLHIISALGRSCVVSQFFEISFVIATALNLENFSIYGGKKIRKKTFWSPLLFKGAGAAWHFLFNSVGTVPALPAHLNGREQQDAAQGQGTRHRGPDPTVLLLRAACFISLCLCFSSHPLFRWWTQGQNCLLLCKDKVCSLEGALARSEPVAEL